MNAKLKQRTITALSAQRSTSSYYIRIKDVYQKLQELTRLNGWLVEFRLSRDDHEHDLELTIETTDPWIVVEDKLMPLMRLGAYVLLRETHVPIRGMQLLEQATRVMVYPRLINVHHLRIRVPGF